MNDTTRVLQATQVIQMPQATRMAQQPVRFGADDALVGMITTPAGQPPAAVGTGNDPGHRASPRLSTSTG